MAKEIKTSIVINATAAEVWSVLTDFASYPQWNPFLKSITGVVKTGNRIVARIEPPEAKGMTFKPKVLAFEENKEFRWIGHLLFPGLFDGEHIFELVTNADGSITFIQREKFKGILVPLFKKMLDLNTVNGFNLMNTALKERVENN